MSIDVCTSKWWLGYGIRVEDCITLEDITWAKLDQLCKMAGKTFENFSRKLIDYTEEELGLKNLSYDDALQQATDKTLDVGEFFEKYCNCCETYGIGGFLMNVINEVEGIETYCTDDDYLDYHYVLIGPSYPWFHVSEKEKNLTQISLWEIFKKYVGIFTDRPIETEYWHS